MSFLKRGGVLAPLFMLVAMLLAPTMASASTTGELTQQSQVALFDSYHLTSSQRTGVVIDSNLSYAQAIGDDKVPASAMAEHMKIRPFLRVVPVVYHGYDTRIHLGQIVVHEYIAPDVSILFAQMFVMGFPIKSVIPESQFGYIDENSMLSNNSSGYRPADQEHGYGVAVDVNTFTNPFDVTDDNGVRTIDPPGAMYNPQAKGAITMEGPVRKAWTKRGFEWGGNWGNPAADPQADFFQTGYFDYQHWNLSNADGAPGFTGRYDYFHNVILPQAGL